jgi:hypothetical protein
MHPRSIAAALVVTLWSAAPARAEDWNRVTLRGGTLIASFGSTIRLDADSSRLGTSIDLEDDLGLSSSETTFFVDGVWRISRRSQVQVSYENADRIVSKSILDRTITVRNSTFEAGAALDTFLDTRFLTFAYGYAIVATPRLEVGATIGVTALRIATGVGLSVTAGSARNGGRRCPSRRT